LKNNRGVDVGLSPSARIEKLARVPPEKTSRRDKSGLPLKSAVSVVLSIPAAGMWPASLKTTKTAAVISIFLRMEGF